MNSAAPTKIHYHIRWLASGELDWERHDTRTRADQAAKQLSRPDERYAVEPFEGSCVKCARLVKISEYDLANVM